MRKTLYLSLAVVAIPVAAATIGPHVGGLRGSLGADADWTVDGNLHGAAVSNIADLGLLGPDYAGESGELDIRKGDYSDAYSKPEYGAHAELAYGVDNNLEVYGSVNWSHMSGRESQLGFIDIESTGEALPLYANFGDYNAYGAEIGARYYFDLAQRQVRPFLGASVGAAYVDKIRMRMTAPDAGVDIANLGFYKSSTVFTAGAEAGVAFGDGVNWAGSLSVGVKYMSSLGADTTDLDSYGIGSIADGGERVVIPIKGSLSISF